MMACFTQLLWTIGAAAGVCAVLRLVQHLTHTYWDKRVDRNYRLKGLPLVGMIPELMANFLWMHDWLVSHFEQHHTLTLQMLGTQECYFTCDVENVKYILKTNFDNYIKGGLFHERFEILLGDGVFNTDGEMWKLQRKTVVPEFSSRNLREFYAAAYKGAALKLSCLLEDIIHQGVSCDLQDLLTRTTLDSIGKVGFGVDIGCLPRQLPLPDIAFAKAFDTASETVVKRFYDSLWKVKRYLKVGPEAELLNHINVIDSYILGIIAQRKLDMAKAKDQQQSKGVPLEEQKLDIITRFLKLAEDENSGVDCKLIRDICLNFVIAGRDSTAVTTAWGLYELIQNQDIAQQLHEELRCFETRNKPLETSEETPPHTAATAQVDKKIGEFAKLLTQSNLKTKLPYLTAVISETLRLHPAVPQIPKGVREDDVLPDGTRVKKGMIVVYSPYCMGRMTYIWGPDAKEFKPERWLQDGKFVMESEYKFTAFQAGARMCLGKDSAYTQVKITTAILHRFFEFQLVDEHSVKYKMTPLLGMANGLKVNVRRRQETSGE